MRISCGDNEASKDPSNTKDGDEDTSARLSKLGKVNLRRNLQGWVPEVRVGFGEGKLSRSRCTGQ